MLRALASTVVLFATVCFAAHDARAGASFDEDAALRALDHEAHVAAVQCRAVAHHGHHGRGAAHVVVPHEGHVVVTFAPSGFAVEAVVDRPPLAATKLGACLEHAFTTVRVAPFSGEPVHVGKEFTL